jgi:hypothetical protein
MAWRFHGQYSPDPYKAMTRGTCDRCQFVFELSRLNYQYEFRGDQLANTRFRVCSDCMDKPYEGYRPVKLPPDPLPAIDPRVEPLAAEENSGAGPFNPIKVPN